MDDKEERFECCYIMKVGKRAGQPCGKLSPNKYCSSHRVPVYSMSEIKTKIAKMMQDFSKQTSAFNRQVRDSKVGSSTAEIKDMLWRFEDMMCELYEDYQEISDTFAGMCRGLRHSL